MSNTVKKKSIREQVELVLKDHEHCRNSDWSFIFQLLKENGVMIPSSTRKAIYSAKINLRTAMREKQYIQNKKGLYPPTNPKIIENKKKMEEQFREAYAKGEVPQVFNN